MTLLLTESFDAWPTNGGDTVAAYLNTKWGRWLSGYASMQGGVTYGGGAASRGFVAGRHGTGFRLYGASGVNTFIEAVIEDCIGTDTVIVGYACNISWANSGGTQDLCLARFDEKVAGATVNHCAIRAATISGSNLVCYASRYPTPTQIGSNFNVPMNIWIYLEIKVKIHDTAGTIEVRVDGQTVFSASGVDTRNAGTGICNSITHYVQSANPPADYSFKMDDYYLLNNAGSAPFNDFLGDVTIEYAQPSGDSSVAWTPSAGANWDAVNDSQATTTPVTTDYVSSSTDDQSDLYTLPSASAVAPSDILAVASYGYADKTDSGSRTVALTQELSGSTVQSSDLPLRYSGNGGPQYLRYIRDLAPDGAAWTLTKRNSMKTGIKARP